MRPARSFGAGERERSCFDPGGAFALAGASGALRPGDRVDEPLAEGPWLASGLLALGVPAVCIDARHAQQLLATMTNKTDRNDARALAGLARVKLFREVYVKPR
jgi:hypothetical protein